MVFAISLATTTSPVVIPEPQRMELPVLEANYSPWAKSEATEAIKCSCVLYVKSLGFKLPKLIDASNFDINSRVPIKSGLIFLAYNDVHHIAYVESIQTDGIHVREANFLPCLIGERIISHNDEHIVGFYRIPDE